MHDRRRPTRSGSQLQCLLKCLRALGIIGYLLGMNLSLPAATKAKVVTQQHVMIPMRDGVRLSAWIYLPKGQGPWPVLMEQRYTNVRAASGRYTRLAEQGYVVAGINFRGTAQSEGTFVGYRDLAWGPKRDGYDATEWLARQPWSNGKVGSFGSSQAGFAQNLQAVTQPPHLVCQFMVDTGLSLFHDGYRMGGSTRYVQFRVMEQFCRKPQDNRLLVEEWTRHPTYDAYWEAEDSGRYFDKMNVPCFTVASWFDDPKGDSSIRSFIGRQHHGGRHSRGNQKLLIGPWPHGGGKKNIVGDLKYPGNASAMVENLMLRWFAYYLQGEDTGVLRDPAVRYYVTGATGDTAAPGNVWREAADFPPEVTVESLYFQKDGSLVAEPPALEDGATAYTADPTRPANMPDLVTRDMRQYESDPGVISFTSPALSEPTEWTGRVDVELFVTSTARDTDFIVKVCDVYPDGRSIALINSIRRARYRAGFEQERFLQRGQVARIAFDLGWLSQIFNRHHRIRVIVASTGVPYYEPNPQTGERITSKPPQRTQVAVNRVLHNQRYASRILVPRGAR
ncbi:MAG: CocE/NonD family hydrolase [Planctomycetota bacterium]|nr:CocE/NonD family hydrolase [Planctomycetota bacterium]